MLRPKLMAKLARILSAPSLLQELCSLECMHLRWLATFPQGAQRMAGEGASRGGRDGAIRSSGNDHFNASLKQKQGVSNEQLMDQFVRYDENQGAQRASNREVRGQCPSDRIGLTGRANSDHGNPAAHGSYAVRGVKSSGLAEKSDEAGGYCNRHFVGHNKGDERLDQLDNSYQGKSNRKDDIYLKGRAVTSLSYNEPPDAVDETDVESLKAIKTMNNEEFEKHLRHKENAMASKRQNMVRSDAHGEKTFDKDQKGEEVSCAASSKKEMTEQEQKLKKLPNEYNVCKARVHSILWECEKRKLGLAEKSSEEENGGDKDSLVFDSDGEVYPPLHLVDDKSDTPWNNKRNHTIEPKHWEGSVQPESMEDTCAKEETMMLEEFERRMEYNRLQIAAFVKHHLYSRRRPVEGWNYIVEKFGSEGKIGKSDGKQGKWNDFEKSTLKRVSGR